MEEVVISRQALLAMESIVQQALQGFSSESKESLTTTRYLKGINGLAKFLNVSAPKAQQIKNSGKLAFTQQGRIIYFEVAEVLKFIDNQKTPAL